MIKRIVYNKWYWWISNDINIWQSWSQSNIEWLDIHSNSKYIRLSKSHSWESLINTRVNWKIIASLYESNTNYIELTTDWYLTWLLDNDVNNWNIISWDLSLWRNLWKITNWSWDIYWFMISSTWFNSWVYDITKNNLWTYDTGTWIQTDPEFNLWTWWTIWANWTITWWKATHTAWSTEVLSRNMTCDNTTRYRLATNCTISAWTCVVKVAWSTIYTLWTADTWKTTVEIYTSASTTELLEFIPSNDFSWSINSCKIQELNILSSSKSFSDLTPYNVFSNLILIWNWNVVTEVDMTIATPVIQDVFTIDKEYTIVWITRISDQFFIYATNWSNWRQYIWDWITWSPARIITWVDKPIQNVANFANIDYVIVWTSKRQQICIVNWYQLQPVVVTDDYINTNNRIYFDANYTNSVETIWNRLLIWWEWWVFWLWNKTPWLPSALSKEFIYNSGCVTNMFYAENIWYSLFIYLYTTINWVEWNYRMQIILTEWNNNENFLELQRTWSWWIETQPIYWDVYSNIKNLYKYTIWFELPTWTIINTYINEIETENYACLYFTWNGANINVWDTYTYNTRTFTVISKIQSSTSACLLYCSYSWAKLTLLQYWTFTRATWTWLSTFYADRIRYWYKMIYSHTDTTKLRETINITRTFNESNFAIELLTTNELYTPKLYDFNVYFDEITND